MSDVYQGSSAIYTIVQGEVIAVVSQTGQPIRLASMDVADLCGGGVTNSLCYAPGDVLNYRDDIR